MLEFLPESCKLDLSNNPDWEGAGDYATVKDALAAMADLGVNALAGGTFEPKPVVSKKQKALLCLGVVAGYFDLYSDIQG
jgi:hypothetical protein